MNEGLPLPIQTPLPPARERKRRKPSRRREIERKKNILLLAGRVLMVFAGITALISTFDKQIEATEATPEPTESQACFSVDADNPTLISIWQNLFAGRPGDYEFENSGGPGADGSRKPIRIPGDQLDKWGVYHFGDRLCGTWILPTKPSPATAIK